LRFFFVKKKQLGLFMEWVVMIMITACLLMLTVHLPMMLYLYQVLHGLVCCAALYLAINPYVTCDQIVVYGGSPKPARELTWTLAQRLLFATPQDRQWRDSDGMSVSGCF
jgi:uncharacterized SAM-binding protein YcdF (DUF218 family)